MPIVLIGISISLFFVFTNPFYNDVSVLRTQMASYNEALNNSKALETERDALTQKYNAIDPNNLEKIKKFLPDNVDNIRLILEIEQIAAPYGITLKDVKYNATDTKAAPAETNVVQGGGVAGMAQKDYGAFDLSFSASSTYDNFINFTRDLESNLRMVDISSITFSPGTANPGVNPKVNSPDVYSYNFKIRTYWLKN